MHDFSCSDPALMNYPIMKEVTRYYKETQEGVEYMCKAFEEVRNEGYSRGMQQGASEEKLSNIRSLMENTGWSAQKAMDTLNVSPADQAKYAAML